MRRMPIRSVVAVTAIVAVLLLVAGPAQAALNWRGLSDLIFGHDPEQVCRDGIYFGLAYPRSIKTNPNPAPPPPYDMTATANGVEIAKQTLELKNVPVTIQLEPSEDDPAPSPITVPYSGSFTVPWSDVLDPDTAVTLNFGEQHDQPTVKVANCYVLRIYLPLVER